MTLRRYLGGSIVLTAGVMIAAFTTPPPTTKSVLPDIERGYLQDIDRLGIALHELQSIAATVNFDKAGRSHLQAAFRLTRAAYKRTEFLIEFTDPYAAARLNGVPVPKVNANDKMRAVIEPEGFQTIEEAIYSDDPGTDRSMIVTKVAAMVAAAERMHGQAGQNRLIDRHLFEASREQLVRVMSLGLSGFDTPASGNSIEESAVSLEGVRKVLAAYSPALEASSPRLLATLDSCFARSIEYLRKHSNFDTFDRLYFIRELGNPLYATLLAAHRALGIETAREASPFNRPVNYYVANIFDTEFLDPNFYSHDSRYSTRMAERDLGRVLFFDPVLSGNNRRACASCHRPEMAFTDGRSKSLSFHGNGSVSRNAPTIINSSFQRGLFHDGRSEFFEDQIQEVLLNANAMGSSFESILTKLRSSPEYLRQFAAAYGSSGEEVISANNVKLALGSYMRSLVALSSPFDRYMRGEIPTIAPPVARGFNLFMGKAGCGTCHFAPLFNGTTPPAFTDTEIEVLGVTSRGNLRRPRLDSDLGRYSLHNDGIHRNAFRTPGIRNVALTGPYMHNGMFRTLEEVVEFYDRGGGAGLGLAVPNQTLPSGRLQLTRREKADIVAFMKALTDTAGTTARPSMLPSFPGDKRLDSRILAGDY